ncbi:hypothetical protein [Arsenicibacter rosenii]|uniref:Uncharacterized protein n=1 Tax=Arsenicibacter rosenii TaxID=1750698 RepID=A0A1S2VCB7_9BACT|nr:hypothetical protein [Arsenicibacter rosenii]OIN55866.1 hypothetical protein BLX24_27820 [Arsenicibacter rosenii]
MNTILELLLILAFAAVCAFPLIWLSKPFQAPQNTFRDVMRYTRHLAMEHYQKLMSRWRIWKVGVRIRPLRWLRRHGYYQLAKELSL